jgi:hypothetical protein
MKHFWPRYYIASLVMVQLIWSENNLLKTSTYNISSHFLSSYAFTFLNPSCSADSQRLKKISRYFRSPPYKVMHVCGSGKFDNISLVRKPVEMVDPDDGKILCTNDNTFNPVAFLSLLRNKTLSFYGDSLTRQLYNAVIFSLYEYQTSFVHVYHPYYSHSFEEFNVTINYCEDGYGDHFFRPGSLEYQNCTHLVLSQANFLVIGISAWFKPYFRVSSHNQPNYLKNSGVSLQQYARQLIKIKAMLKKYYQNDSESEVTLNENNQGQQLNSKKSRFEGIIWRLSPHAGNQEDLTHHYPYFNLQNHTADFLEYLNQLNLPNSSFLYQFLYQFYSLHLKSFLNNSLPSPSLSSSVSLLSNIQLNYKKKGKSRSEITPFEHYDPHFWTSLSYFHPELVAPWVVTYNDMLVRLNRELFNDTVFDWYSLSTSYLDQVFQFFNGSSQQPFGERSNQVTIHRDSLHYCVESVPLSSTLLLYDVLKNVAMKSDNNSASFSFSKR